MIIFLPVRNGGHYLKTAIGSVLAQTDDDWRLVVLENGSTDDTMQTIGAFGDTRITCIPAHSPLGIVENWQRATDYLRATGAHDELVTFIGHDDCFAPEFVDRIASLVAVAPDATLYQTAFDLIDSQGALIRPSRPVPASESWTELAAALCWNLRDSFGTGYAFRAKDYLAVGGIPDFPLLLSSDHLLFIRLAKLGRKCADPRTGCRYRLHPGSTSGGMSRAKLNAHVEGLAAYVEALVTMTFAERQEGRDALASLLARELWTLRLPGARHALTAENRRRCADLERLFARFARDINLETWARPEGGGFDQMSSGVRRLARSLSLYRQTRKR